MTDRPHLVVDADVAAAEAAFGDWATLERRPGRAIAAADIAAADGLIVRSVTRVDAGLLAGSAVRFVGSATIGTDHVDTAWLTANGIDFAHAPGCNAAAVADWVVAALAALAADGRHAFGRGSAGIIGAGAVGSRVAERLAALGHAVRLCDPPRAEVEGAAGFVDLEAALASDVVSLHVPLTAHGVHPTRGLIDARALERIPRAAVLLNAARGGIVAEDALATRLDDGPDLSAVIDTWSGEPAIDVDLLQRVALATPHIAGYSLEGRLRGTARVAQAAAGHFGAAHRWDWRAELPAAPAAVADAPLVDAVLAACDPRTEDRKLRAIARLAPAERGPAFDALRRDHPVRREFGAWSCPAARPDLVAAGFGRGEV